MNRLPHHLRLIISLLRIVLGLNFFYLGFTTLFNQPLGGELRTRSIGPLYYWLTGAGSGWFMAALPWLFMAIGACLIVGFATRLVSAIGIGIIIASYSANINVANFSVSQLVNDDLTIALCLVILFFTRAGEYLGIDKFIHLSLRHKQQ
ncbi:MAG TPA: hypothetical protein VNG29_02460 [Candidatus Paceibacterota bacterium]|nr:hypothetical protein [Candidatus Paceibacterota bacterium]